MSDRIHDRIHDRTDARTDARERLLRPCESADQLHAWVRLFCGLDVPRVARCDGHDAPFEYLRLSYFEPSRDLVVWAPRGGGKTRLAAVATLLDLLHKPGCQVRILGGSLEQSMKMWNYLLPDLHRLAGELLASKLTDASKQIKLQSGSGAAVLTQSQRAVRGLRVQKLRCDEVELFDPAVWEAAQLTTKSLGKTAGAVEAISTLHESAGLMSKVVEQAGSSGTRVVRWCLLDVLEQCPPARKCDDCSLFDECGGMAKTRGGGFVTIDDAVAMKKRVSQETWDSEMLCRRPSRRGQVFPAFDVERHVKPFAGTGEVIVGIDFGFAAPLVALWIVRQKDCDRDRDRETWHVIDEYVQPGRTLAEHIVEMQSRRWPKPSFVGVDPAGAARSGQTGTSDIALLRQAGYAVRHRQSYIRDGLELIRRRLNPAAGEATLFVDPRCEQLIAAMLGYRYAPLPGGGFSELPVKDGTHDHLVDALRYALINDARPGKLIVRRY